MAHEVSIKLDNGQTVIVTPGTNSLGGERVRNVAIQFFATNDMSTDAVVLSLEDCSLLRDVILNLE
jgi:hypothetical protein